MSVRLANQAQKALSDAGIDVVPSLTGNARCGSISLIDPASFGSARSILKRAGITARRTSAVTVELSARRDEEDEEDDFDTLVSSWREFAKRSSENGFKKASKIQFSIRRLTSAGYDPISAAHQLAEATYRLSGSSLFLKKLARALKRAAKRKDRTLIHKLLAKLTTGPELPKPIIKDPNVLFSEEEEGDLRYSSTRTADPEDDTYNSAQSFLLDYVHENNLTPEQILRLKVNPGEVYEGWKASIPDYPEHTYNSGWLDAVEEVAALIEEESRKASVYYLGPEDTVDSVHEPKASRVLNAGFLTTAALDASYSREALYDLAGKVIDHYVVDDITGAPTHPEDITAAQVRSYLRKIAPDAPADKVAKMIKNLVQGKIPKRHEEKESAKKHYKNICSCGTVISTCGCTPAEHKNKHVEKRIIKNGCKACKQIMSSIRERKIPERVKSSLRGE